MGWWKRLQAWLASGSLPNPDSQRWLLEAWRWLLTHAPQPVMLRHAPLLRPSEDDFPLSEREDPARARQVFSLIKEHCGMTGWRCALKAQPASRTASLWEAGIIVEGGSSDPGGTFSETDQGPLITYEPDFCADLSNLVAVLAHETAHLRLSKAGARRPWGPETEEPLTDLCAIAMGFGIFLCNTAIVVRSHGGSQSITRSGYLSERERGFALAIFTEIQGRDPQVVARALSSSPRYAYRAAITHLREHFTAELDALRSLHAGPSIDELLQDP